LTGDGRISLSDYEDRTLSPVRSSDLREAADHPEDNPFFPFFADRLRKEMEQEPEPLIGFSMTYLSQALATFAMLGFVRSEFPAARIILGGALVTSWMKNVPAKIDFGNLVDHIVAGPGEKILLDMLGSTTANPEKQISEAFSYKVFPREAYLSPGLIVPYSTSTGCYYGKCSFCPKRRKETPMSR
jgi:hypothetical protein